MKQINKILIDEIMWYKDAIPELEDEAKRCPSKDVLTELEITKDMLYMKLKELEDFGE